MCGIAGLWSEGLPVRERSAAVGMILAGLVNRGPDCSVIVEHGDVSLGFCRLSITGDPGTVQPVRCGHVIAAVNGEIYNYRELWANLPRELRGSDRPSSDSAVVAPLALRDGKEFVAQLDGIFAGVVVDQRQRALVLFRDHVGIKPLHYLQLRSGIAFASTASALVPLTNRDVDPHAMHRYLTEGYVAGEKTLIKGIRKVPAGSLVTFTAPTTRPDVHRWFTVDGLTNARRRLRETVVDAVRSEIPANGPTVTTLSGGIDSTLVTLLAAREGADPTSLTVRYDGLPTDPDVVAARRVTENYGIRHQFVDVSANDYLTELADGWRFDQPLADPNAIALNRLCRQTGEIGSRVLMVGDGADEVFCGYPYYLDVAGRSSRNRLAAWRFSSMTDDGDRAFARIVSGRRAYRPFRPAAGHPLRIAQLRDMTNWLEPNLLAKADRFGMADQVEIRPPLLRKAVVQAGLGLPVEDKVDPATGLGKIALRRAFADILPTYVLDRPKHGFPCPLGSWLRGDLGRHLRAAATWSVAGCWNVRQEQDLWVSHMTGRRDWGQQLWRLAVARSWWLQTNQPRASVSLNRLNVAGADGTWHSLA